MTKLLEQAIETLRRLPPQRQDEIAEVIAVAAEARTVPHTAEQLAAIDEGIADADAGRFAREADVAALFAKYHVT